MNIILVIIIVVIVCIGIPGIIIYFARKELQRNKEFYSKKKKDRPYI